MPFLRLLEKSIVLCGAQIRIELNFTNLIILTIIDQFFKFRLVLN